MDRETLERLMTDRALGGLPPDTEALLAAYLADKPAARAMSEGIEQAVAGAKAALGDPPPEQVPAFPAGAIRRAASNRRWAFAGRMASLAACVLIGIGVHAAWMGSKPRGVERPGPAVVVNEGTETSPIGMRSGSESPGFWSARRWYEQAGQRRPESGRRMIWDSPLSTPRIGDAT